MSYTTARTLMRKTSNTWCIQEMSQYLDKRLDEFRSPKNKYREYVKVLLGSRISGESVSGWMQETPVLFPVTPCVLICFLAITFAFCVQMA